MDTIETTFPIDVRITPCVNGYLAIPLPMDGRMWDFTKAIFATTPTGLGALLGTVLTAKAMDTP